MSGKKQTSQPVYKDAARSVDARVKDLVGRMTVEEKVWQLTMYRIGQLLDKNNRQVSPAAVRNYFGNLSIGCMQDPRIETEACAKASNTVQKYLVEHTRLGIPSIIVSECLHGHMSPGATMFPQAIALGSTWNPELIQKMAEAVAKEARSVGVAQALSPDLDLARDPRWGRVEETYGEDPFLTSRIGVSYVKGMQGEGPMVDGDHVACTLKHFAGHGSPEGGLNLAAVFGGPRELYTLYLPPFEAAVKEAGALSVMPCYSEYDGVPAHSSKLLLTRVLREQWGFQGYVFSDYSGVNMLWKHHKTAASSAAAGKQALEAGMDLEAPAPSCFGENLLRRIKKGDVSMATLNCAVERVLRVKFLTGVFENPYVNVKRATLLVHSKPHRDLARKIAQESIVLLKNTDGLLPLKSTIGSIAVIGPNADIAQLGDYSRPPLSSDVSPLNGIRKAVSKKTKVRYAQGCHLYGHDRKELDKAVRIAEKCDVAVVVIGGNSSSLAGVGWGDKDYKCTCGEGYDRTDLNPPGIQEDLVRAIYATGTPTVVVLMHGRPYSIPWIAKKIPAIIECWYPGEQGGHALADILFGKVNPSGKLPVSVPQSVGHIPVFYNHKPNSRGYYGKPGAPEQPGHDYVFSSPKPLFTFGYGLSYTTFKYSRLRVTPRSIAPGGEVTVRLDVTNTGRVPGKEVVQLYLNDMVSSVTTPVKVLRRFEKIRLRPKETKTVCFTLFPDDLMVMDENMNRVVEPGLFEVMVGGLKTRFKVTG